MSMKVRPGEPAPGKKHPPTHRQRLDRSIDRNPTRSTIHLESADFSGVNGHDPQSAFSTSFVGPDPLTSKSAN